MIAEAMICCPDDALAYAVGELFIATGPLAILFFMVVIFRETVAYRDRISNAEWLTRFHLERERRRK